MTGIDARVEVEFTAGVWTDVTEYWVGSNPVTMTAGRSDTDERVQPGRLSGLVLDNTDGRFTVGNTAGAYWPNVISGKRVRVSVQDPGSAVGGTGTYDSATDVYDSPVEVYDTGTGAWVPRFTGRIDGWPLHWEDNGSTCLVTIGATDTLTEWAQSAMSYGDSWMYRRTDELDTGNTLSDYWQCTWMSNGGDLPNSAGRSPLVNNGTAPTTLAGAGLPGDPRQTPEHVYGTGFYFADITPPTSNSWTVTAWVRATSDPPSTGFYPIIVERVVSFPPGDRVAIRVKADAVWLSTISAGGIVTDRLSSAVDIIDGSWHCVRLDIEESAGTVTASIYVDNVGDSTTVGMTVANSLADSTWLRSIKVGSSTTGSVAHVAYWDGGTSLTNQQIASPAAGLSGSGPTSRLATIATWAGLTAPTTVGTTRAGLTATNPFASPLDHVAAVEDTEGGLLWCDGDGTVVFNSGYARTKVPPLAATLDAGEINPDLAVAADNVTVVNDVTLTNTAPVSAFRPDPTTSTVRVSSTTSIAAIGPRTRSLGTAWYNTGDPGYLRTRAEELLSPSESPRIPTLPVQPLTLPAAQQSALLSAQVWDLIAVTGLPAAGGWLPDWLGRIEGWSETVGADQWDITFNMSFAGARLEDATFGVVGTMRLG